jgi:prophage maintenance system killer protein
MIEFLERNAWRFSAPSSQDPAEEVATTIEAVAAGSMDERSFSLWLNDHVEPATP